MIEPDADDSIDPDAWQQNYPFRVVSKAAYFSNIKEMEDWLQDLVGNRLIDDLFLNVKTNTWYFKRLDDATAFKMRWG